MNVHETALGQMLEYGPVETDPRLTADVMKLALLRIKKAEERIKYLEKMNGDLVEWGRRVMLNYDVCEFEASFDDIVENNGEDA